MKLVRLDESDLILFETGIGRVRVSVRSDFAENNTHFRMDYFDSVAGEHLTFHRLIDVTTDAPKKISQKYAFIAEAVESLRRFLKNR